MKQGRRDFIKTAAAGVAALSGAKAAAELQNVSRPPNILLLFPDQWRYDWMSGRSDLTLHTPCLDALAARGTRFERAWVSSPLCAPSRACLASGKAYHRCHVPSNKEDYPADQTTFYGLLRDAGYHVTGCGKFDLNKGEQKWGLDGAYKLDEWGFTSGINNAGKWDAIISSKDGPADPYMKYLYDNELDTMHKEDFQARRGGDRGNYTVTAPTPLPEHAYCDNWEAANAIKLLGQIPENTPWFIQVNFSGPHPPVDITKRMDAACRGMKQPAAHKNTQLPDETHTRVRENYSAMTENIDRLASEIIAAVDARGELDNTIIIFSSDHGEMLGDHDLWGKKHPYEASVGVPLIIAGPEFAQGRRSDALVDIMDLAATCLTAAELPVPEDMDSRTLIPYLRDDEPAHRDHIISALGDWQAVRDTRYKLVRGFPEIESLALYDLANDPNEDANIAADHPDVVARLQALLPVV